MPLSKIFFPLPLDTVTSIFLWEEMNKPTVHNSPNVETSYVVESTPEGVYQVTTRTRYNAEGAPPVHYPKTAHLPILPALGS